MNANAVQHHNDDTFEYDSSLLKGLWYNYASISKSKGVRRGAKLVKEYCERSFDALSIQYSTDDRPLRNVSTGKGMGSSIF